MTIGPQFIRKLNAALNQRLVAEGSRLLDQADSSLAGLDRRHPQAAELLLLIAQWSDVGYRDHHFLEALLAKFPMKCRRKMPLDDYLRLSLVEAFRALSVEDMDRAIEILDFVLKAGQDSPDHHLVTLACFWKGRAHRRKGEYEAALNNIARARERAQISPVHALFTAVIQIHEAWLLFQTGLRKEALRLLTHAESALKATDDFLALGNIESARGRIIRRGGEYSKALDHFDRAIAIYSAEDMNHRNLARALVNGAYVRRIIALQLRKRIDAQARRSNPARNSSQPNPVASAQSVLRARYEQICQEAIEQLKRAKTIFTLHSNAHGVGSVLYNSGYLHLDRGDIDHASEEALGAYRIGLEKNDHILMARARILQAATENARIEEQLGEDVDAALHANQARQYSEEAMALAQQTQNRRLLLSAHMMRGMTAANDFFQEWELAKRSASEATNLIVAGDNDYLLDDLATLKSRIIEVSGVNETLREWSEGMLGEKSFQQVTEEFAEIVIPKVWMREEKKISRVAETLSISPKKVRRILRNAGFLDRG